MTFNFNFNPISEFGIDVLDKLEAMRKQLPMVNNTRGGLPSVVNNTIIDSPYPRLTTSGQPIPDATLGKGINVKSMPGGGYASNGSPIIKNVVKSIPGIKFLGGPATSTALSGLALLPEYYNILKHAWNDTNLNTMDPDLRNQILRAAGKENEISKYKRQNSTVDDLPMPYISKQVARFVNRNSASAEEGGKKLLSDFDEDNKNNKSKNGNNKQGGNASNQIIQQASEIAKALENAGVVNKENRNNVIDYYINELRRINNPYINALQNYINNYNNMLDQRQRAARFWQGVASGTGNQNWARLGSQYDALTNEANKVAAVKQLQDARLNDLNAINEAIGNAAVTDELGISPEASFANKNLLTALSMRERDEVRKAIADANLKAKLYGIDQSYNRALTLQKMRNDASLRNALIREGAMPPGLNQQGTVDMEKVFE